MFPPHKTLEQIYRGPGEESISRPYDIYSETTGINPTKPVELLAYTSGACRITRKPIHVALPSNPVTPSK